MRVIIFILQAATLTLLGTSAQAGAWLQPQGQGLAITQSSFYSTSNFYDALGNKKPQATFSKYEFAPYVEYGLLSNLTIGGSAFFQNADQNATSNLGIADPQLFARTEIWSDEDEHVSLQPLVKFASIFEHKSPPRGGSRSTDFELSALYGRSLNLLSARDYVDLRVGYRLRANRLHDQFLTDIAMGFGIADSWMIIPAFRQVLSTSTSSGAFSESGDLDYDLSKIELTALYALDEKRKLSLGIADHIAGRQTGDGYSFTASYARGF